MSVKPDKRKSAAFHRDQSGRHAVRMLDCVKADWSNFAPSKGLQHRSGKFRVEFHVGACPIRHVENVTAAQQISLYFRKRYRRSEEHTSELQSLMRISYAVFCLKKKK